MLAKAIRGWTLLLGAHPLSGTKTETDSIRGCPIQKSNENPDPRNHKSDNKMQIAAVWAEAKF